MRVKLREFTLNLIDKNNFLATFMFNAMTHATYWTKTSTNHEVTWNQKLIWIQVHHQAPCEID